MISFVKFMLPLTRFISFTSLVNLAGIPPAEDPLEAPPLESVLLFYFGAYYIVDCVAGFCFLVYPPYAP